MKSLWLTLAGVALCSGTAEAIPIEDRATQSENEPPRAHRLDHRLVVDAPVDVGRDTGPADRYVVVLGEDLPLRDGAKQAECGVLTLGGVKDGHPERMIELHVERAKERTPLDRSADIGRIPGQVTVHLNPPVASWTRGFLNVDFDCDGVVNARYGVYVMVADAAFAEDEASGDVRPGSDEEVDAPIDAEASSGCSAAAGGGPPAVVMVMLGGLALAAHRRRKAR